jgi:hypothetical protein
MIHCHYPDDAIFSVKTRLPMGYSPTLSRCGMFALGRTLTFRTSVGNIAIVLHQLGSVENIYRLAIRHILSPVSLLNICFKHCPTARALEGQKLRQQFRRRLLLSFTAPELVVLFALRTMERNRQRRVVNRHARLYPERDLSAILL